MSGIEFLEAAMDLFPRARRALLTAYADTDAAIAAINVVDVDHYLLKPWDPPEEKLYPVVDAMIETYAGSPDVGDHRDQGHRPPLVPAVVRDPRLPGAQRRALPLVRRRRAGGRAPARGSRPGRDTLPVVITADGTTLVAPETWEVATAVGLSTTPITDFYDLVVVGGGPGRARRGGLRRLGGAAHAARRAAGDRRPGRAVVAHRELPRLPRRRLGCPAHRPGAPAGDQVRGRDPHRPRRHRPARRGLGTVVDFADGTQVAAHGVIIATGRLLPGARRPGHRASFPAAASTTARPPPRRATAPTTTSTSSAAPTPPGRPRCSSRGTAKSVTLVVRGDSLGRGHVALPHRAAAGDRQRLGATLHGGRRGPRRRPPRGADAARPRLRVDASASRPATSSCSSVRSRARTG